MKSCNHRTNRAQQFCGRYGEHIKTPGVKIDVAQQHGWWWKVTCDNCRGFLETFGNQDDAILLARQHHKTDHPRDLVAFSINP